MPNVLPPGITQTEPFTYYASSEDDQEWFPFDKIKQYTNAFIVQDNKILLGYKKRGFGQGKYNGFGGKVESGETSLQAAIRELEEESGVKADLEHAGSLLFFTKDAEFAFQIEIYRAHEYTGTITESDEMRPEWFSTSTSTSTNSDSTINEYIDTPTPTTTSALPEIPFAMMWDTDKVWFPLLISKQKFFGRADFTKDGEVFKPFKWWYGLAGSK